ncbi:MAG: class I SAM-dependent methyltransferase [Panacagrimonas sp.]
MSGPDVTDAQDVPSPIDLRTLADASVWAQQAMAKRPWREDFFAVFAEHLQRQDARCILELGSGPGFLAQHLLQALPQCDYTLLDFSAAMHALASARLGALSTRTRQVLADFKTPEWSQGLRRFDAVVTMQAVHELRHKRHASALHRAVQSLLNRNGQYLVCDHYVGDDGMKNDVLYMSVIEQQDALRSAGFAEVSILLRKGGLVLHSARCAAR